MALTPEDVLNKNFTATQFRRGYDEQEVDDFLDEVVAELRRLTQERDDLGSQLEECRKGKGAGTAAGTTGITSTSAPTVTARIPTGEDAGADSGPEVHQAEREAAERIAAARAEAEQAEKDAAERIARARDAATEAESDAAGAPAPEARSPTSPRRPTRPPEPSVARPVSSRSPRSCTTSTWPRARAPASG